MPVRDTDPPLRRSGGPSAGHRPEGRSGEGRAGEGRAQSFAEDVFSEYHTRRREAGGRPYGLIAGVAIGLVAVAGIGGYMWSKGLLSPGAGPGGTPQLVQADPDPYKVKPENPGGMQVENQDKLVYDRVAKGEAPPRVENLLPPPEEPKAPPQPAAPPPPEPEPETAVNIAPAEPAKPAEAAKIVPPPPAEAAEVLEAAKAAASPAAPAPPGVDPLAAAVAAATGGRTAATGPIAAAPAAPASAPGAFQVQLASARSSDGAMAEWKRISEKNAALLSGLTPNVAQADLGDKGVFFRLRAGPLADRAAADALCARLASQNVACIVVRP